MYNIYIYLIVPTTICVFFRIRIKYSNIRNSMLLQYIIIFSPHNIKQNMAVESINYRRIKCRSKMTMGHAPLQASRLKRKRKQLITKHRCKTTLRSEFKIIFNRRFLNLV